MFIYGIYMTNYIIYVIRLDCIRKETVIHLRFISFRDDLFDVIILCIEIVGL